MKRFAVFFLIVSLFSVLKISYNNSAKDKNFYCDEVTGFIYRAPWNTPYQLVFITEDYCALVNTSGMSYEMREKARKGAMVTIRQSTFRVPERARNRGLFDQKRYYNSRGISYICSPREKNISFGGKYKFKYLIHLPGARFRSYGAEILESKMNYESGHFTLAVMTGDTGVVSADEKELFVSGGLSHLMCVSGMHVVYFMMPFRKISRNKYLDYKKRRIFLIFPLLIFLSLSDFSPSVVRASFSALGLILSGILKRKNDSLSNLFFSASFLLLCNPYTIVSTGFILSYISVFSLNIIYPAFLKRFPVFQNNDTGNTVRIRLINKETLAAGICVNMGIAPVMLCLFGTYSLFGIILTLIASPLAALICVGGYLCIFCCSIPGISVVGAFMGKLLYFVYKLLIKAASLPGYLPNGLGHISLNRKDAIILSTVLYLMLFIFFIADCEKIKIFVVKYLRGHIKVFSLITAAAITASVCSFCLFIYDSSVLNIYAADVGQGLCLIVQSGKMTGMIDTGDGSSNLSDILSGYNINKLDFVILTHSHSDHTGGMNELIQNFRSTLIISEPNNTEMNIIEERALFAGWNTLHVKTGDEIKFGKTTAEFISVSDYFTRQTESDENNGSLCIRLSCRYGSVFVSGDIQSEAEKMMAEKNMFSKSDVLIVPHHGSKYSSSENLLMNIGAEYGIISVGRQNSYGHPSDEAIERLSDCGYKILRTDLNGAVCVRIGRKTIFKKGRVSIWTML